MQGGGPASLRGDAALSAVLSLHNLSMSGGLVDAVERLEPSTLDAAEAGYRWLGLNPAAEAVRVVRTEIGDGALDDEGRAEALELRADEQYAQVIPTDQTLVEAFQTKFNQEPEAFAST